jgi:O-acetyl-ADP-ribose deacetylase (regulator of RNase III)
VFHRRHKSIVDAMPHMPIAHCISEDRAQTRGVAKVICRVCPVNKHVGYVPVGCVSVSRSSKGHVYNLVTKKRYFDKPSYEDLKACLIQLREKLLAERVAKIAIPELGCGLDGLQWNFVLPIIRAILAGLQIDIYVYKI